MWSVWPQPYLLFFIYQQAQQIEACYSMEMVLTVATFSCIFSITYMGYWRTFFRRKIEFLEAKVYFNFYFFFFFTPKSSFDEIFTLFHLETLDLNCGPALFHVALLRLLFLNLEPRCQLEKKKAFEDLQLRRENISFKFLSVFSGEIIFQACLNDLLVL